MGVKAYESSQKECAISHNVRPADGRTGARVPTRLCTQLRLSAHSTMRHRDKSSANLRRFGGWLRVAVLCVGAIGWLHRGRNVHVHHRRQVSHLRGADCPCAPRARRQVCVLPLNNSCWIRKNETLTDSANTRFNPGRRVLVQRV